MKQKQELCERVKTGIGNVDETMTEYAQVSGKVKGIVSNRLRADPCLYDLLEKQGKIDLGRATKFSVGYLIGAILTIPWILPPFAIALCSGFRTNLVNISINSDQLDERHKVNDLTVYIPTFFDEGYKGSLNEFPVKMQEKYNLATVSYCIKDMTRRLSRYTKKDLEKALSRI